MATFNYDIVYNGIREGTDLSGQVRRVLNATVNELGLEIKPVRRQFLVTYRTSGEKNRVYLGLISPQGKSIDTETLWMQFTGAEEDILKVKNIALSKTPGLELI